jgi:hypothetical protein
MGAMSRKHLAWAAPALGLAIIRCVGDAPPLADGGADVGTDVVADVVGDAGPRDANAEGGACDPTKPFGASTAIPPPSGIANASTGGYGLTPDELRLFFAYLPDSGVPYDIYSATRAEAGAPFLGATPLSTINSAGIDIEPKPSADALTLFFTTNGWPVVQDASCCYFDIYYTTRPSLSNAWSAPMPVPNVNTGAQEMQPFLSMSGNALYFVSDRAAPLSANSDIYRSPVSGTSFGNPSPVSEINSSATDGYPAVTLDELAIFWSSNRAPTIGGLDVWTATRASTATIFSNLTHVAELSTISDDAVVGVSPDGCRLYFRDPGGVLRFADRAK